MLIVNQELSADTLKAIVKLPSGKEIQVLIRDAKLTAVNSFGAVHYLYAIEVVSILDAIGYPYYRVSGVVNSNNAIWEIH